MFKNSKWIWINNESNKDEYAEFFVDFFTTKKQGIIHLSCDSDYTLFVNGEYVDSNQYGDYEHYKIYDSIDISSHLKDGKNTVKIFPL